MHPNSSNEIKLITDWMAHPEDEYVLQLSGRELGHILTTEVAVQSQLKGLARHASYADFLGKVWLPLFFMLPSIAIYLGEGVQNAILLTLLTFVICWFLGGLVSAEANRRRILCERLDSQPELCAQLLELAQHSPAVKRYIHQVNASGRELRVFDVACANQVYCENPNASDPSGNASSIERLKAL